ncbi:hypothetical protein [Paraliomyxa miuraensis]|uniref:hypothetical protein n=1 Tax=Paraliomyxa miuraensis TaxID=376150 RepID=UPI00225BC9E8|nr:hypothetical protein [Paraliomyxa miuraensis]MCX4247614.1 hypothetical protein [Paraliomyxa miuraensis]
MSRRTNSTTTTRAAQRYWEAYEATLEPPPERAARNLARIRERIAAGERVDDEPWSSDRDARHDRTRRSAAAGLLVLGKPAAISVGLGVGTLLMIKLAVTAWVGLGPPPATEPAAASSHASKAEPPTLAPAAEPASAGVSDAPPSPTWAPEVETSLAPSPPHTSARPVEDRLRAEVALMDRARTALERDDARVLWRLLDEHERRFPRGALVEERSAWRAVAACRLHHADAAARAGRFVREHPGSAQVAKVRQACPNAIEIE